MIHLKNLSKTYEGRSGTHDALHDVTLHIERGDVFGIIGQSGAGKSTLVRCINLLERPTSGSVVIDGVDVTCYQGKDLRALRARFGMILQGFSLFQQRDVLRNVTFPLELRGVSKASADARARELLSLVGLADKAGFYPSQLSGGQQQRVAIARALANDPKILLCDEATSALDTLDHAFHPGPSARYQRAARRDGGGHHPFAFRGASGVQQGGGHRSRTPRRSRRRSVLVAPRSEAARLLVEADDVIRPHRPFAAAAACAKEAV